jgi:hypothetical protein
MRVSYRERNFSGQKGMRIKDRLKKFREGNYERVENIKQGSFTKCRQPQSGGLGICKIVSGL